MDADVPAAFDILKGKRVKLTLKSCSYTGILQRINPEKTVVLADVSCSVPGRDIIKHNGSVLFFGRQILNVEVINDANTDCGNVQDHKHEEHLNVEKFQPYWKTFLFGNEEDEEECINYVEIHGFHEKFVPAVMDIKTQCGISVGVAGVEAYQHERLCWLLIATKDKVYLFDILRLGAMAFKNGLSMILESKKILKVIHDCRIVAGCLWAQFGVKLTNVFDTQVADVMCFHSETGGFLPDRVSTLQEVVGLHLKVPSYQLQSLQMTEQLTKEKPQIWQERPCPVPLLKVMALSVIHLRPLRLVLLDALMKDYMVLVESYLTSDPFQPNELQHITMESALALPDVLRQLEHMRGEKQERALARYPVTEEGLLKRFNPQAPASHTSPAAEQHVQADADSVKPALVDSPSSEPVELSLHKPPASPLRVPSVMSVGRGRGCTEVQMGGMGRGKPLGKDLKVPPFPAIGRGFLLQIATGQIKRESTGNRVTALNPRAPASYTSPAAEQHVQADADSVKPALVDSPSSEPVELSLHKPPASPLRLPSVMSVGRGRGCTEVQMGGMGRGKPLGKDLKVPPLPAIGRGFLLQIATGQIKRESTGNRVTAPQSPNSTQREEAL